MSISCHSNIPKPKKDVFFGISRQICCDCIMRSALKRFLNPETIERVVVRVQETPKYLAPIGTAGKDVVVRRVADLNDWYTRLLGLDEVKRHQDRVVNLQERLLETQEMRRNVGQDLADIRKKSNLLQDEILKVKRHEDVQGFLNLMREETELLRQESDTSRMFQQVDQAERELFQAFTNAVRDSHEKQRAQLEYTKYFGLILSITGSFLAFCYTTWRKNDLKDFIEKSLKADMIPLIENSTQNQADTDLSTLINLNSKPFEQLIKTEHTNLSKRLDRDLLEMKKLLANHQNMFKDLNNNLDVVKKLLTNHTNIFIQQNKDLDVVKKLIAMEEVGRKQQNRQSMFKYQDKDLDVVKNLIVKEEEERKQQNTNYFLMIIGVICVLGFLSKLSNSS